MYVVASIQHSPYLAVVVVVVVVCDQGGVVYHVVDTGDVWLA